MKSLPNCLLFILCTLILLCRRTNAQTIYLPDTLDFPRELLFDTRPAPALPNMLQRREGSSVSLTTIEPTATTASSESSFPSATATSRGNLPSPFDMNLGNNFTSTTCPTFFTNFLNNPTFQTCLPFSLLLQSSNGFFQATHSLVRLTQTLDATCDVDFPTCAAYMAQLAHDIAAQDACGADLQMQNPMALEAANGFLAYAPLYHAGCLTDAGGAYCYANAVTNSSAPASSYIYYLPLGVPLPANARPACTTCLQNTMSVFAQAASNRTQPLAGDYAAAAQQVDGTCGTSFVQAAAKTSGALAGTGGMSLGTGCVLLFIMFVSWAA